MTTSETISSLAIQVIPLTPDRKVDEVADLFLSDQYRQLLSLPVVESGRPVGVISRYQLMKIFLKRYGRELYGKHPVSMLMNQQPLVVDGGQNLELASQFITQNIQYPVTEDFIIVRNGEYQGVGVVLDLLRAIEVRLASHAQQLESVNRSLKSSQARLVQSEKMASLGQMVAGVAHEINTPLGYIRNNVEMAQLSFEQSRDLMGDCLRLVRLLSDPGADELALSTQIEKLAAEDQIPGGADDDMPALFNDTLHGIEQISELVLNLKNFSRLDKAMESEVNLNENLDSVLVIAKHVLKNRVTVVKQYGEIPQVHCASSQLNQVFLNILTNAAQAIEDEGRILLKTEADDQEVHVVIQDNGKGMTPEVMSRVFDPFFTTKPIGEGTGLGLSISYQIVQQHGGRIRVASAVGQGTKFVVSLPRQPAEVQSSTQLPALAQSA